MGLPCGPQTMITTDHSVNKCRAYNMFWLMVLFVQICVAMPPKLVWVDEFHMLDTDTWSHLVTAWGGGNEEFQYYRNDRRNSFVEDGKLHIRPTFTADEMGEGFLQTGKLSLPDCNHQPCSLQGNGHEIVAPVFSARISTMKSFAFKFGRVEIRAKMPRGDWIWPAIWLLPESSSVYGGWPTGGEIDMVEVRANKNYTDQGNNQQGVKRMGSTLHFGPNPGNNAYHLTNYGMTLTEGDFSDDFHTFCLEWNNSSLTFSVDGKEVGSVAPPDGGFWELGRFHGNNVWANGTKMAPFDQKFYLIMNVAVGGRYFPDGWLSNGKPRPWNWRGNPRRQFWDARKEWMPTWDRPEMIVDHVLVYGWD